MENANQEIANMFETAGYKNIVPIENGYQAEYDSKFNRIMFHFVQYGEHYAIMVQSPRSVSYKGQPIFLKRDISLMPGILQECIECVNQIK